ncbi:hypothetical protein FRC19_010034 [Serendipita sp. 401]|nr:hypothetical protein FRC19_010034 [Serendipita sp. 401]
MTTAPSSTRRYTSTETVRRPMTTAPSSGRHSSTSAGVVASRPPSRPQSLSYRQLLQQRLQKYQWTASFHVEMTGPVRNPLWSGSFWLGGTKIGQSSWHTTKDAAKEDAAKQALNWLNTYGYH